MTRNLHRQRQERSPLKLRVSFTANLSNDERILLDAMARCLGYDHDGQDERTVIRRLLEDRGLNAISEAADMVEYRPARLDDTQDSAEEGGDS